MATPGQDKSGRKRAEWDKPSLAVMTAEAGFL